MLQAGLAAAGRGDGRAARDLLDRSGRAARDAGANGTAGAEGGGAAVEAARVVAEAALGEVTAATVRPLVAVVARSAAAPAALTRLAATLHVT
ncbi:hypothetical protein [Micromonospora matsumotoense]|uniref:hypothetical protein n=1 Tax=Micromonospora matsumotoense TaxID=121616 RepID=UPI0033C9B88D